MHIPLPASSIRPELGSYAKPRTSAPPAAACPQSSKVTSPPPAAAAPTQPPAGRSGDQSVLFWLVVISNTAFCVLHHRKERQCLSHEGSGNAWGRRCLTWTWCRG